MSAKRVLDAPAGARHFKQTKLSFFTSASQRQKKRPRLGSKGEQEDSTTASTTTKTKIPHKTESTKEKLPQSPKKDQSPSQTDDEQPDNSSTASEASQDDFEVSQAPSQLHLTLSLSPSLRPSLLTTTTPTSQPTRIQITDKYGDIFSAPPSTLLIHACNCIGSWSGGIALAFRNLYPREFAIYRAHCLRSTPDQLLGTALLIPPQPGPKSKGHLIGCLFTSRRFGSARDSPERILRATGPALRELMRAVAGVEEEEGRGVVGEVRMCRINSGLFAVPWERTKTVLGKMGLGEGRCPGVPRGSLEVVAYERE